MKSAAAAATHQIGALRIGPESQHQHFAVQIQEGGVFRGSWRDAKARAACASFDRQREPLNWPRHGRCAWIGRNTIWDPRLAPLLVRREQADVAILLGTHSNLPSLPNTQRTVFATRGFAKGAVVAEYAGVIGVADDRAATRRYCLRFEKLGTRYLVDSAQCGNEMRFVNSACGSPIHRANIRFELKPGPNGLPVGSRK